jgi:hypothetical protein
LQAVSAPRSTPRSMVLFATYAVLGAIAFAGLLLLVLPAP